MNEHPDGRDGLDIKPTDLRGILRYVPLWRGHIFVVAFDGSAVDDENFPNLLLDIAVLRSLHIQVVLVHGIGRQLKRLAEEKGAKISDAHGQGPTDDATLPLAIRVSGLVSHAIVQGLTANGLRCALPNAVRATEMGIVHGVDQRHTGKVEKIDGELIRSLLDLEVVPVLPPICYAKDGRPFRVNSDLLASELAVALRASKLIYLTPNPGLVVDGQFVRNVEVDEVRRHLEERPEAVDEKVRSKAGFAVKTIAGGTPRAHILDCRVPEGLLTEIFSAVGIGTMIHGNEYQQIRRARKKDVPVLHSMTKAAVKSEALRYRSQQTLEREIDNFYVYEIDGVLAGCVSLIRYPGHPLAEVAAVYVQPAFQKRGLGLKLVEYAVLEARREGRKGVFALSTQSYPFFKSVCHFEDGTPEDLPEVRRKALTESRRNSKVLLRRLS